MQSSGGGELWGQDSQAAGERLGEPLRLRAHLPLDAQRPAVADPLQPPHERGRVRLPGAERHLAPPLALHRRPVGVLQVYAADVRGEQVEHRQRVVLVVQQHVRRVEVHPQGRAHQVVECAAEEGGGLLTRLEGDNDIRLLGQVADLVERVEERLAGRVAHLGDEPGVQHQVRQAEFFGAGERPLEAFEPLGAGGRVAEPAGAFDVCRGGVVLSGEAEHGAGHAEAGGDGGGGHGVAFDPTRVVRVAAGDLHHIHAEAVEEAFQFGDAGHLQGPTAHADGERFDGGGHDEHLGEGEGRCCRRRAERRKPPGSGKASGRATWPALHCMKPFLDLVRRPLGHVRLGTLTTTARATTTGSAGLGWRRLAQVRRGGGLFVTVTATDQTADER